MAEVGLGMGMESRRLGEARRRRRRGDLLAHGGGVGFLKISICIYISNIFIFYYIIE